MVFRFDNRRPTKTAQKSVIRDQNDFADLISILVSNFYCPLYVLIEFKIYELLSMESLSVNKHVYPHL